MKPTTAATRSGSDRVSVDFTDVVLVRRGILAATARETQQSGVVYGDWYVIENLGVDAIVGNPDSNFDVGHNPTGMKIYAGMTFWEARRLAMALDDADIYASANAIDMLTEEPDAFRIIEAIVASALMDHYVFPLSNYLENVA